MHAQIERTDRFAALPDDEALAETVAALQEHGFGVEVVDHLDAAREAVLARIPDGSLVMTNPSVTLEETGIAEAIDAGGSYDSARMRLSMLDRATQLREMKTILVQPDFSLGSVHAVTRDGILVIASRPGEPARGVCVGRRERHLRRRRAEARLRPRRRDRSGRPWADPRRPHSQGGRVPTMAP